MSTKTHQQPAFEFTAENKKLAEKQFTKYPADRKRSAIKALLDLAQRQNGGHLDYPAMEYVAGLVDMSYVQVHEVASFYNMFKFNPVGKHHLQICTTTPCMLRGSQDLVDVCRNKLKLEEGQVTKDGLFSYEEVECLGACVNAPLVMTNDDYFEDLDKEAMEALVDDFKAGKSPKPGPHIDRETSAPQGGRTTCLDQKV